MVTFQEIIQSEQPVLVDFFATWCGPCKTMTPVLQKVKQRFGDSLKIIKVDVDKQPQAAQKLNIQGVPTLVLFRQGKILWRQSGVLSPDALSAQLQKLI